MYQHRKSLVPTSTAHNITPIKCYRHCCNPAPSEPSTRHSGAKWAEKLTVDGQSQPEQRLMQKRPNLIIFTGR